MCSRHISLAVSLLCILSSAKGGGGGGGGGVHPPKPNSSSAELTFFATRCDGFHGALPADPPSCLGCMLCGQSGLSW